MFGFMLSSHKTWLHSKKCLTKSSPIETRQLFWWLRTTLCNDILSFSPPSCPPLHSEVKSKSQPRHPTSENPSRVHENPPKVHKHHPQPQVHGFLSYTTRQQEKRYSPYSEGIHSRNRPRGKGQSTSQLAQDHYQDHQKWWHSRPQESCTSGCTDAEGWRQEADHFLQESRRPFPRDRRTVFHSSEDIYDHTRHPARGWDLHCEQHHWPRAEPQSVFHRLGPRRADTTGQLWEHEHTFADEHWEKYGSIRRSTNRGFGHAYGPRGRRPQFDAWSQ